MYVFICISLYILQVNVVHIKSGAFVHGCISVKLLLHMHRIVIKSWDVLVFFININS